MFNKDVLPLLGEMRTIEIKESDLRGLLRKIVKERNANRVAVRIYKDIVQLFKWAEERQPWRRLLVEGNPAKLINIKQIISPEYEDIYGRRERILSEDEICELNNIFNKTAQHFKEPSLEKKQSVLSLLPKESQLACWICLSTLCRIGEFLMAQWNDINFEKAEWFIPKANVKSTRGKKQDLLVFLSPFALKQFKALHHLTGTTKWCFPGKDSSSHIYEKTVTRQIGDRQAILKKKRGYNGSKRKYDNSLVLANGKNGDWTPHDLRRTGATMMQKLKISPDIIDRCQNHVLASNRIRRHYQLYDYADEKKEAWFKWRKFLDDILG